MKLIDPVIRCGILLCLLTIGAQAQSKLEGYWAGGSNLFGRDVAIQTHFEKTPAGYTGHFSVPKFFLRSITACRFFSLTES